MKRSIEEHPESAFKNWFQKVSLISICGITMIQPLSAKTLTEAQAQDLVKQAYTFGYPVVDNYRVQYSYFVDKQNPDYKGAWNQPHSVARVYTPKDVAIQTANSDTPYTFVGADLRTEPLVLTVPKIENNRYYSIQFVDMYTHNFDYVGTRTTGNDAGNFLLAGPDWKGTVPKNIKKVIRSESDLAFLLYRTQLFSEKDLPKVIAIQKQYKVTPLSKFLGLPSPKAAPAINFIKPQSAEDQKKNPEFFNTLNFALQYANVHPSEKKLIDRFKEIGVEPGKPFVTNKLSPQVQKALPIGISNAWKDLQKYKIEYVDTGKHSAADGFGTRQFMQGKYLERMTSTAFGIYGNTKEEALYPVYFVDSKGELLDGNNKYQLTFPAGQLPPARSFWSLTLYKLPESLLYDNQINRYLINSSMTDKLVKNKDGSITLYVQNAAPSGALKANWLPAPKGPFSLVLRLYWPEQSALNGSWKQPSLNKVK